MDTNSVSCLVNSISRLIHLVACQNLKSVPTQKDYGNIVGSLKLLKPVLDEIVDSNLPLDEVLIKECEGLDVAVNEAREFMENWSPKMSKICSVLKSEPLATKVQSLSLEICRIFGLLLQSSRYTSCLTCVQHCMHELQCLEQERISDLIEEALRNQIDDMIPSPEHLIKIVESLGLTSNQDLLKENVLLEKERMKAQVKRNKWELDQISQIVDLISNIRDCMAKLEQFETINGIPIPPYFRCPLSLELMSDPVIVASGLTYERAFIQKWLDHGLNICPKSRQILSHTNLVPNYTVKALIAHWCEDNKINLFNSTDCVSISTSLRSHQVSPQDFTRMDSFHVSSHSSNCISKSSHDVCNCFEKQRIEVSSKCSEDASNIYHSRETKKYDCPSPEHSYIHSRSESVSSAISSVEYIHTSITLTPGHTEASVMSSKHWDVSELSGEVMSKCASSSPSSKDSGFSRWLSSKQILSPKTREVVADNARSNHNRSISLPFLESGSDDSTNYSHVEKLVADLKSQVLEIQTAAAAELRLLAKHNVENRIIIGQCGAIEPLISLLYSEEKLTQEHAVTALLNLSINEDNKAMIGEMGAIEPLIHVLKTGNAGAKENSAATLFSLSVLEEYKIKIGRSDAIKALVDLLGSGTIRGKKDAATALFNLSIFHENKARIVQTGAVKYLIELLDPATEMIDKAIAVLANLSTIAEGRLEITREGGIPLLVEVVEEGSQRGKENAASILLQLCISSPKLCSLVLQEGAVPPLVALSQSGTPRAKEKNRHSRFLVTSGANEQGQWGRRDHDMGYFGGSPGRLAVYIDSTTTSTIQLIPCKILCSLLDSSICSVVMERAQLCGAQLLMDCKVRPFPISSIMLPRM